MIENESKKVLVTGSSGLVGRPLVRELKSRGYEVLRLVRSADAASRDPQAYLWNPRSERGLERLPKIDSVIHLAGESIACLLYTSPSPRDATLSRMPSSA